MNDGREYSEMLKTMASSCDVVVKPAGRARKKKDVKEVKEETGFTVTSEKTLCLFV